jgi:hypothetical protein
LAPEAKRVELPWHADHISALDPSHLRKFLPDDSRHMIRCDTVRAITFADLLQETSLTTHIDLLMIDTEGHDYEIVRQVLSTDCRPAMLIYEHTHLSVNQRDLALSALVASGYSADTLHNDTVATLTTKAGPATIHSPLDAAHRGAA